MLTAWSGGGLSGGRAAAGGRCTAALRLRLVGGPPASHRPPIQPAGGAFGFDRYLGDPGPQVPAGSGCESVAAHLPPSPRRRQLHRQLPRLRDGSPSPSPAHREGVLRIHPEACTRFRVRESHERGPTGQGKPCSSVPPRRAMPCATAATLPRSPLVDVNRVVTPVPKLTSPGSLHSARAAGRASRVAKAAIRVDWRAMEAIGRFSNTRDCRLGAGGNRPLQNLEPPGAPVQGLLRRRLR